MARACAGRPVAAGGGSPSGASAAVAGVLAQRRAGVRRHAGRWARAVVTVQPDGDVLLRVPPDFGLRATTRPAGRADGRGFGQMAAMWRAALGGWPAAALVLGEAAMAAGAVVVPARGGWCWWSIAGRRAALSLGRAVGACRRWACLCAARRGALARVRLLRRLAGLMSGRRPRSSAGLIWISACGGRRTHMALLKKGDCAMTVAEMTGMRLHSRLDLARVWPDFLVWLAVSVFTLGLGWLVVAGHFFRSVINSVEVTGPAGRPWAAWSATTTWRRAPARCCAGW